MIAAAALKCMGGAMQGKLYPRNDEERGALVDEGYDLDQVLTTEDLVAGDDVFFAATGVTDGYLLRGVRYHGDYATTWSLVMRARSGTVRRVEARHAVREAREVLEDRRTASRGARRRRCRPCGSNRPSPRGRAPR